MFTCISIMGWGGWVGGNAHFTNICVRACVRMYMYTRACVCMRVRVRACGCFSYERESGYMWCARVCVSVSLSVFQ